MVHDSDTPDREAGVDFGDVDDALDGEEFPATGRELIEAHGDRRIGHPRGSKRFGDVLEPLAEETYESSGEVHQAVLSVIGEEAVEREGYSDRDPPQRDDPDSTDRSF